MLPHGTIDVHAHFLPPAYREALRSAGFTSLDGGMPIPDWSAESALGLMDELGIAAAMLSVSSPFAITVAGREAARLCRQVNDEAAAIRQKHPTRFGAYAMLPVPLVDESLAELTRALDVLHLDGIALPTNAAGLYLGDPRMSPVLDALAERRATVFVHPTSPCCFEGFGLQLPAPMIEFPFDTTRAIVSLLYSKRLEWHTRIRFIFAHGGGTLPFLASRIARIGEPRVLGDRGLPADHSLSSMKGWHYDLALVSSREQVTALRGFVPTTQIVYGTDFPFSPAVAVRAAAAAFDVLPFDANERAQVTSGNAALLFPLLHSRCSCAS